eukprot:scaffold84396_cov59-Phaeocystis_antarctica.AAC.6
MSCSGRADHPRWTTCARTRGTSATGSGRRPWARRSSRCRAGGTRAGRRCTRAPLRRRRTRSTRRRAGWSPCAWRSSARAASTAWAPPARCASTGLAPAPALAARRWLWRGGGDGRRGGGGKCGGGGPLQAAHEYLEDLERVGGHVHLQPQAPALDSQPLDLNLRLQKARRAAAIRQAQLRHLVGELEHLQPLVGLLARPARKPARLELSADVGLERGAVGAGAPGVAPDVLRQFCLRLAPERAAGVRADVGEERRQGRRGLRIWRVSVPFARGGVPKLTRRRPAPRPLVRHLVSVVVVVVRHLVLHVGGARGVEQRVVRGGGGRRARVGRRVEGLLCAMREHRPELGHRELREPLAALAALAAVALGEPLDADGGLAALLDDERVQQQLLPRAPQHALLEGVLADEAVDAHLLGLADAVRAVLRLQVDLRVVARVVQHHRVRRGEVDAHAARARRDQVEEGLRGGRVERAHVHLARDAVGRAVEPEEGSAQRAPPCGCVLLEHVECQRVLQEARLREDERARAFRLGAEEQPVEQRQLAARRDEAVAAQRAQLGLARARLCRQVRVGRGRQLDELRACGRGVLGDGGLPLAVDGEHDGLGMVAHLLQLHQLGHELPHRQQLLAAERAAGAAEGRPSGRLLVLEQRAVPAALQRRERHLEH